jgi:hypothetical protein
MGLELKQMNLKMMRGPGPNRTSPVYEISKKKQSKLFTRQADPLVF